MTAIKARVRVDGHTGFGIDCSERLMYYVILFIGVMSFLAVAASLDPSRRKTLTFAGGRDLGQADQASDFVARLLKGERKEDMPCLTPIDCVRTKRCDGHCGCR
jgi:hypothetical protein